MLFPCYIASWHSLPVVHGQPDLSYIETRCESDRTPHLLIFLQVRCGQYYDPVVEIVSLNREELARTRRTCVFEFAV